MPISVFDDQSIEISCPRCGRTSPKTVARRCANDRFTCVACNSEIVLERAELPAELNNNAELEDVVSVRLHKRWFLFNARIDVSPSRVCRCRRNDCAFLSAMSQM